MLGKPEDKSSELGPPVRGVRAKTAGFPWTSKGKPASFPHLPLSPAAFAAGLAFSFLQKLPDLLGRRSKSGL